VFEKMLKSPDWFAILTEAKDHFTLVKTYQINSYKLTNLQSEPSKKICLAIETSCDETSLAFLEVDFSAKNFYDKINSTQVLSSVISSQIDIHKEYGGVVPEVSARAHAEQIHFLFQRIVEEAKIDLSNLSYIFVTAEPGLMSALKVGIEFAKSIKFFVERKFGNSIEINKVNHLQGHVASSFFEPAKVDKKDKIPIKRNHKDSEIFPHLHLLVSGGNTQLRLLNSWTDFEILGQTLDDAVGETYDKIGRMLGLQYPSGAVIEKIAKLHLEQNPNPQNLPVSMLRSNDFNFSLSGLKTAARYKVRDCQITGVELEKKLSAQEIEILLDSKASLNSKLKFVAEICISTVYAINQQTKAKLQKAIHTKKPKSMGLSGGVSASQPLRDIVKELAAGKQIFLPDLSLTGDNAIMIGLAGVLDL
jgi:N6-L-threonylcarbamoyladenine synthase